MYSNNEKKQIKIIKGNRKDIVISQVKDYIEIEEPQPKSKNNIIIPKRKEQS